MAETILTPGSEESTSTEQTSSVDLTGYLQKVNYLSEFETESDKTVARRNLGVLAAEDTYTKEEVEPIITDKVDKKIAEHLDSADHITTSTVLDLIKDLVKIDGTTPFTAPQKGVAPESSRDLTTKSYVDSLIATCLKIADRAGILDEVANTLASYARLVDVYTKDQVYTKGEIDDKNTKFVKIDGTTPFESPQSGRTPQISSHLTTKGYVDTLLQTHKDDIDPHNFTTKLSEKLKKYALIANVYDKSQTYSRNEIDSIIDKLVELSVEEALRTHTDLEDPHGIINKVRQLGYVLKDGSIAFTQPQKGVAAINNNELVTLGQTKDLISTVETEISNIPEPVWKTSGPVESTVGHVEDNTQLQTTMTLQEVCDAIFYGQGIDLTIPDFAPINTTVEMTVCVHGSTGLIDYAEVLQGDTVIATFYSEDFVDGCITLDSNPILDNTDFTFRVYYTNEAMHEVIETVYCHMPVFIGLLPKWEQANTLTMARLMELASADDAKTQNQFVNAGETVKSLTFKYQFQDAELRHPFIVLPATYPDLDTMVTKSQSFGIDAFDIINMIPMTITGLDDDVIYKIYVYKEALSSLNQEVTFNFVSNESVQ